MKKNNKPKKEFHVAFGYKLKDYECYNALDDKFEILAKKFNGENVGSGYGFGARDLSMQFKSRSNAEKFVKYLSTYYKKRVRAKNVYYTVNMNCPTDYRTVEAYDGNFKIRKDCIDHE